MIYKTIFIDLLQTKVMCHEEIVLVKNGKKKTKLLQIVRNGKQINFKILSPLPPSKKGGE